MAKLRRRVIYTDIRWEETDPLTEEQIKKWKSEDDELQEEVMEFPLKCLVSSPSR